MRWRSRGSSYGNDKRRAELQKLAAARLAAMTKEAKVHISAAAINAEEQLILGGLESDDARTVFDQPTS